MKVNVLICSYNKSYHLKAILKNLNNQTADRNLFEVCLVIDGSTDETMDMLKEIELNYNFTYHYIENVGLTGARNMGIELCKGDYILFCDDDVLFEPDFLSELSESINQNPDSVHIGNLMNIHETASQNILDEIILKDKFNYETLKYYQVDHTFFNATKILFSLCENKQIFKTATWWAVITGGNLCIPSECFKKAGMFDTNIQGWGPEDADLCYRIFKLGYNAIYNKTCVLYHLDHKRNSKKISESMTKNAFYFYKKFNKPVELSHYLKFMNGVLSLKEFNNACCEVFGIRKVEIPDFYMSMKNYTDTVVPTFINKST